MYKRHDASRQGRLLLDAHSALIEFVVAGSSVVVVTRRRLSFFSSCVLYIYVPYTVSYLLLLLFLIHLFAALIHAD